MRRSLFICIALAMTVPAGPAFAQDESSEQDVEFNRLTSEASKNFEAGRYDAAAGFFLKAYEIKPVSNILYNVGRVYEKAGDLQLALDHFERFVKAPNVEQAARQDAIERIKTIREVLALEAPKEDSKANATIEPAPKSGPDHTLSYILMGAGGVTLVTSGVMAFLASSANDDFENASTLAERRDAADSGGTYAIVADSLLITGVVLTGVGAVLYFTAGEGEEQTAIKLGPTFDAHSVGLGLEMNY
jgi:tetratricopeptide (TPR) repeat protein